jgi:hypothetical protein
MRLLNKVLFTGLCLTASLAAENMLQNEGFEKGMSSWGPWIPAESVAHAPVIEIAKQRGITTGTVENHLADFISNGQVNVFDFLSQRDIDEIQKAVIELYTTDLKPIKVKMGEALSYSQVKMGLSYLAKVKSVDAL